MQLLAAVCQISYFQFFEAHEYLFEENKLFSLARTGSATLFPLSQFLVLIYIPSVLLECILFSNTKDHKMKNVSYVFCPSCTVFNAFLHIASIMCFQPKLKYLPCPSNTPASTVHHGSVLSILLTILNNPYPH